MLNDLARIENRHIAIGFDTSCVLVGSIFPALNEYHKALHEFRLEALAQLFEMGSVQGNWTRQDNIMKKTVPEFQARGAYWLKQLDAAWKRFMKTTEVYQRDEPGTRQGKFDTGLDVRQGLIYYLVSWFDREAFNGKESVSEAHSHHSWETLVRRAKARLDRAFDMLDEHVHAQIRLRAVRYAEKAAGEWIRSHAPTLVDLDGDVRKYFGGIPDEPLITAACEPLLLPSCGNPEFQIGLAPVLVDGDVTVWYFGSWENEHKGARALVWKESREPRICPVFDACAALEARANGYSTMLAQERGERDLSSIFEQLEEGGMDWLSAYLHRDDVIGMLAYELFKDLGKKQLDEHGAEKIRAGLAKLHEVYQQHYGRAMPALDELARARMASTCFNVDDTKEALGILYPQFVPVRAEEPAKEPGTP